MGEGWLRHSIEIYIRHSIEIYIKSVNLVGKSCLIFTSKFKAQEVEPIFLFYLPCTICLVLQLCTSPFFGRGRGGGVVFLSLHSATYLFGCYIPEKFLTSTIGNIFTIEILLEDNITKLNAVLNFNLCFKSTSLSPLSHRLSSTLLSFMRQPGCPTTRSLMLR